MKNIKRIIIVMCFMAFAGISNAQPPTPGVEPTSQNRGTISINRSQGPIGTATGLLLCLAGGCIAYKLKRNTTPPHKNNHTLKAKKEKNLSNRKSRISQNKRVERMRKQKTLKRKL